MRERVLNTWNDFVFVWQFAIDDFKTKYAGSALGFLWAFLQPLTTIVLYWFVFQLGFRAQPINDFPFILWLMVGLVPWFFFSDAVINATACLVDYSYLVKKVLFHINILPLAKIISVFLVQMFLLLFVTFCYIISGYAPSVCYIQLLLYWAYMILLATGISYITATLYVFFKDIIQIVPIVMQVVFWLTPIVWPFENMPESVRKILVYNPFYYIIAGFRNVFVYRQWSRDSLGMVLYYWIINFLILGIGLRLFHKCKDHFADVL